MVDDKKGDLPSSLVNMCGSQLQRRHQQLFHILLTCLVANFKAHEKFVWSSWPAASLLFPLPNKLDPSSSLVKAAVLNTLSWE